MYSRLFQLTIVGLLLSVAIPGYAQERIAYGTTRTQSSTYTYAVAAAKSINTVSGDKVSVTVISTGGAVDNLGRMSKGQIKLGLGNMASVYQAYNGIGKFKGKKMGKLRGLWLYQRSIQPYIVRQDSGIDTLEGLQGKSWSAGQRGSATASIVSQTLDVLNIKPDYYNASLSDALKAIKDGRSVGYVKAMKGTSLDSATIHRWSSGHGQGSLPVPFVRNRQGRRYSGYQRFPHLGGVQWPLHLLRPSRRRRGGGDLERHR
jgi:TRAP transporter TAXI family solute receptor